MIKDTEKLIEQMEELKIKGVTIQDNGIDGFNSGISKAIALVKKHEEAEKPQGEVQATELLPILSHLLNGSTMRAREMFDQLLTKLESK